MSWEYLALCQEVLTLLDSSDQYAELNQLGLSSPYNLCKQEYGMDRKKEDETIFFSDYLQLDLIMLNSDSVDAYLKPGCPSSTLSMPPAV